MATPVSAQPSEGDARERAIVWDIAAHTEDVLFRYELSPTPGYSYLSPGCTRLTGYSPQEHYADARLYLKILHPEDRSRARVLLRSQQPPPPEIVTFRLIHRSGDIVPVEVSLTLGSSSGGERRWLQGIIRDVTGRTRDADVQRSGHEPAPAGASSEVGRTRVVVVDDHEVTRLGVTDILARQSQIEVVGQGSTGADAVRLTQSLNPDLVIMDVRMPEMNGLDATRHIKRIRPITSVLLLSMFHDPDLLVEAIKAGAAGYVLKDSTVETLSNAISEVLSGGFPVDERLTRLALRRVATEGESRSAPSAVQQLSDRELEVLSLLAQGATNREIGEALMITAHTVKGHVERILTKLGVSDRTQAAVRGIQLGLVRNEGVSD